MKEPSPPPPHTHKKREKKEEEETDRQTETHTEGVWGGVSSRQREGQKKDGRKLGNRHPAKTL